MIETKNVVLEIEKAKNLYNILVNDEIRELNIESFKKKFKYKIFTIGDISVINILNVIYFLSA